MTLKIGLLGKKIGMTQVFADDGEAVPVTAIQVGPCVVVGTRTTEHDREQDAHHEVQADREQG